MNDSYNFSGRPNNFNQQPQIDGNFMYGSNQNNYGSNPGGASYNQNGYNFGGTNQGFNPNNNNFNNNAPYQNPFNNQSNQNQFNYNNNNTQMSPNFQQSSYKQPFSLQNPQNQSYPPNNQTQDNNLLNQLKNQLQNAQIIDIEKVFKQVETVEAGIIATSLIEFLQFLTSFQIGFSNIQADQLGQRYLLPNGSNKVNITNLKKDLNMINVGNNQLQVNPPQQNTQNSNRSIPGVPPQQSLNQIFDGIKRYLVINGGNVFQKFYEMDLNQDFSLPYDDFKKVLLFMNVQDMYDERIIQNTYSILDPTNSNYIKYTDFCKQFYDYANQNQMKDSTERTYQIFQEIKRFVKSQNQSLAAIFASQLMNNQKLKEVYLDFQSFKAQLQFNKIKIENYMMEQSLFLKLDKAKNSKVDFFYFADLLGYEYEDIQTSQSQPGFNRFGMNSQKQNAFLNQNPVGGPNAMYNTQSNMQFRGGMGASGPSNTMNNFNDSRFGMSNVGGAGGAGQFGNFALARDKKRFFYRTFIRHIKQIGLGVKYIEQQLFATLNSNQYSVSPNQGGNSQQIPMASFINYILSCCNQSELFYRKDIIESIAKDFDKTNTNNVSCLDFCVKLQFEVDKLSFLDQFYWKIKEQMDFKNQLNLYDNFQYFDLKRDKKFYQPEIEKILISKGLPCGEVEINYFLDEYDLKQQKFVDFIEIEKDFYDFCEFFKKSRRQNMMTLSFQDILLMIKDYCDQKGKTLREVFSKTKAGQSDEIAKYEFTKIMTAITYSNIDSDSIDKLTQELDLEGKNVVSFSELLKRYNEYFKISDHIFDNRFQQVFNEKVLNHIATIIFSSKAKLQIETQFQLPNSNMNQFIHDLEKEPFQCHQIITKDQLRDFAQQYQQGAFVNTNIFVSEIYNRISKLKVKQDMFKKLSQHLTLRGYAIEDIFQNIQGLGKYKDEFLEQKEYFDVLKSVDFIFDIQDLKQVLETMHNDADGKVSYLDFCKDFKSHFESAKGKGPILGIKYFSTAHDILLHISQLLLKRGYQKQLGDYLAGYDINGDGKIERSSFYRVIESMALGLGEGDIQTLLKHYDPLNQNQIVIQNFIDDINKDIQDPTKHVQLKTIINQAVNEKIMEPLTPTPKTTMLSEKNFQQTIFNLKIIKDIYCGIYCQNKDYQDMFLYLKGFSNQTQGHLNKSEFYNVLEKLNVSATFAEKEKFIDNLLEKQDLNLQHKSQNLNIDFLMSTFTRDFSQSKEQMINEILFEIAQQLTQTNVPIKDQFQMFDRENLGFVVVDAFKSNILENYLGLRNLLTKNKIELLVQKYDPNKDFRIYYNQFIGDLKSIELENSKVIKLLMTSEDRVDHDNGQNQNQDQGYNQIEIALEAKSKKNTVVHERSMVQMIHLPPNIPSYEYEDIVKETFVRGKSVEAYFKEFSTFKEGLYILDTEQFFEALKKLGLKWAADRNRVKELYDAIDFNAHNRQYLRFITIDEIGITILYNCPITIEEIQAQFIFQIYTLLKQKDLLSKIKDMFQIFNTRRDSSCTAKEFKVALLDQINLKQNGAITEKMVDILIHRYKQSALDTSRVVYLKFIKDLELWDKGISPSFVWATEFAEDIIKCLVIQDQVSIEQFFGKHAKLQGVILIDEFKKAINELQLGIYHDENEQLAFFNQIQNWGVKSNQTQVTNPIVNTTSTVNKVNLNSLIEAVKKLCSKTPQYMSFEIMEKIYIHTKNLNMSISVYNLFKEVDPDKKGFISLYDFKGAIEQKLNTTHIKGLDIEFIAQKYKASKSGPQGMIQYEKFFQDYDKIEKYGVKAGEDPLKAKNVQKQDQDKFSTITSMQLPQPSLELYQNMGRHMKYEDQKNKTNNIERLFNELVKRDTNRAGFLSEQNIFESFVTVGIKLSKTVSAGKQSQMEKLLVVLPQEKQSIISYNYLVMIELLFGKEILYKYVTQFNMNHALQASENARQKMEQQFISFDIQPRFKQLIELRLNNLQSLVHQISKGSWFLREQEFYKVFNRSRIPTNQKDLELLQNFFRMNMNQQNLSVDFRQFIKQYSFSEIPSRILSKIDMDLSKSKANPTDIFTEDYITFEQFCKLITEKGKVNLQEFSNDQQKQFYSILSNSQEKIEKSDIIRELSGSQIQQYEDERLPFIVHELVYFIVNHNKDIFKVLNPKVKFISKEQLQQLLTAIEYKPTKPTEMNTLFDYMKNIQSNQIQDQISVDRLIQAIRKVDPQYGALVVSSVGQQQNNNQQKKGNIQMNDVKNVKAAQIQVASFNQKIKQSLTKISNHLKKNKIEVRQLYQQIDKNNNGFAEREEFLNSFTSSYKIDGLIRTDLEQIFDALDVNRDGYLSINEFCLYIEGMIQTIEQRINNIDKYLEKEIIKEVDELFAFFDQNGDGRITDEEVLQALKSVNPQITKQDAQEMIKSADKNGNGFLEREEFFELMVPKLKEEMVLMELNLEELRRIFKEADTDQTNYLTKQELQQVLSKMGVELTEMQLTDLFNEMDLDQNQSIDIDEFIAFLSIADQFKFRNPNSKVTLINIRSCKKLHPIDFFNCFKGLPAFFIPSFTQQFFEQKYKNTPSFGIYPEFDCKSMQYKELEKIGEFSKNVIPIKKFIEMYSSQIGCEIQLEEINGVPLPKQEVFDWFKIQNREVRAILFDFQTHEFVSNAFILQTNWKTDFPNKWQFNANQNHQQAKNFIIKNDLMNKVKHPSTIRDIHILFELVLYFNQADQVRQICCGWGTLPLTSLDKAAKMKVELRGGSPFQQIEIDQKNLFQSKKGFSFLKKNVDKAQDFYLLLSVKPQSKFTEQTLQYMSLLPDNCIIPKRLLSFTTAFRVYCYRKLNKYQQQMVAPQGNFVIAQFRKIFDNPDTTFIIGDCWDVDVNAQNTQNQFNIDQLVTKMEDYMNKLYSIIYSPQYQFNHVYPTRSSAIDSQVFQKREEMIKSLIIPGKYKPLKVQNNSKQGAGKGNENKKIDENDIFEDYKPFNISEMEVQMEGIDQIESKQDEIIKMYMQMGLIQQ